MTQRKIALIFYTSGAGGPSKDSGQITGESVANVFFKYSEEFIQLLQASNVEYRIMNLNPAEVVDGKYENSEDIFNSEGNELRSNYQEHYGNKTVMPGTAGIRNRQNLLQNLKQHIENVTINTLYGYETFTIGGDHSFGGADILAKIFAGVLTELKNGNLVSDKKSSQYSSFVQYLKNNSVDNCDYKEVLKLYTAMYEANVINKKELLKFTETFGVLWADAHADINNDLNSISKNPHGMPLSFAIADMVDSEFKYLIHESITLKPKNILHIFGRDFDPYLVLSKTELSEEEKKEILKKILENERNEVIFSENESFNLDEIKIKHPSIIIGENYAIFESELSRLQRIGAKYILANGENNIGDRDTNKLVNDPKFLADTVKEALRNLKIIAALDIDGLTSALCLASNTPVGHLSNRNQATGPALSFFIKFLQELTNVSKIIGGHLAEVVMELDKFPSGIPVVKSNSLEITTKNNSENISHIIPTDTGANQLSVLTTFAILAQVMSLKITEALIKELLNKDLAK